MPEKELRASLGFQVQEFIPMPVEEAVLDYHVLGETDVEDRPMVRLLLVAAQKTMVDSLVTAALGAKLEPVGLDLVPFAMVRAVGSTGAGMELEVGEALVDVGAHVTNIVVHSSGETRFVRILPRGVGTSPRRCAGLSWRTRSPSGSSEASSSSPRPRPSRPTRSR